MSVADKLTKLAEDLTASYEAVEFKGGEIPSNKNTDSLPDAILSIPEEKENHWGKVVHYSTTFSAELIDAQGCEVEIVNEAQVLQKMYTIGDDIVEFTYPGGDCGGWESTDTICWGDDESMLLEAGIKVTKTSNNCSFSIRKSSEVLSEIETSYTTEEDYLSGSLFPLDKFLPEASVIKYYFGDSITSIPKYTLGGLYGPNWENIEYISPLPEGVTSIGEYSLFAAIENTNQVLVYPSSVRTIERQHLQSYSQPLIIPEGVEELDLIGGRNTIAFPSSLRKIKLTTGLDLALPYNLVEADITVQTPATNKIYLMDNVKKLTLRFAAVLSVNIPSSVENLVMAATADIDYDISLPESLLTLEIGGLGGFTRELTLPQSLESLSGIGLSSIKNAITVNVGNLSPSIVSSQVYQSAFSTYRQSDPSYTVGITIKGANRQAWLEAFPNRSSGFYRNLLDGGE